MLYLAVGTLVTVQAGEYVSPFTSDRHTGRLARAFRRSATDSRSSVPRSRARRHVPSPRFLVSFPILRSPLTESTLVSNSPDEEKAFPGSTDSTAVDNGSRDVRLTLIDDDCKNNPRIEVAVTTVLAARLAKNLLICSELPCRRDTLGYLSGHLQLDISSVSHGSLTSSSALCR